MRIAAIQLQVDETEPPQVPPAARVWAGSRRGSPRRGPGRAAGAWRLGFLAFEGYTATRSRWTGRSTARPPSWRGSVAWCCVAAGLWSAASMACTTPLSCSTATAGGWPPYRKVHLLPYGSREAGLLEPGNEPVTAACEGTTIGLATCFDLRLAELFRMLIDDGAELFVVVSDDASVPLGGRDKRPQY